MSFNPLNVEDRPQFRGGVLVIRVRVRTEMVRRDDFIRVSVRPIIYFRLRDDLCANEEGEDLEDVKDSDHLRWTTCFEGFQPDVVVFLHVVVSQCPRDDVVANRDGLEVFLFGCGVVRVLLL